MATVVVFYSRTLWVDIFSMAKLSPDQLKFLVQHKIPLSQVFDGTDIPRHRHSKLMRGLGMVVAIGVAPCAAAGHTLRTRAGHCAQCGTHNLAFLRRFDEKGDVYVAKSESSGLIKIGTAQDASERAESLNNFGYGGYYDWVIQFVQHCDRAGRVEFKVHKALAQHCVTRTYEKQGNVVNCNELFVCETTLAIATINEILATLSRK